MKRASKGLEGNFKEALRGLHLRNALKGLEEASRGLEGSFKGASPSKGFKEA